MTIWKHWCRNCSARIEAHEAGYCQALECRAVRLHRGPRGEGHGTREDLLRMIDARLEHRGAFSTPQIIHFNSLREVVHAYGYDAIPVTLWEWYDRIIDGKVHEVVVDLSVAADSFAKLGKTITKFQEAMVKACQIPSAAVAVTSAQVLKAFEEPMRTSRNEIAVDPMPQPKWDTAFDHLGELMSVPRLNDCERDLDYRKRLAARLQGTQGRYIHEWLHCARANALVVFGDFLRIPDDFFTPTRYRYELFKAMWRALPTFTLEMLSMAKDASLDAFGQVCDERGYPVSARLDLDEGERTDANYRACIGQQLVLQGHPAL